MTAKQETPYVIDTTGLRRVVDKPFLKAVGEIA